MPVYYKGQNSGTARWRNALDKVRVGMWVPPPPALPCVPNMKLSKPCRGLKRYPHMGRQSVSSIPFPSLEKSGE